MTAAGILFAQDKREARREKAKVKIEAYKERLNLSENQLTELKEMREALRPELEALQQDESKSRSERMHERADIIERQEAGVAEILNDEQEAELKAIQREVRENARERRKRKRERRKG